MKLNALRRPRRTTLRSHVGSIALVALSTLALAGCEAPDVDEQDPTGLAVGAEGEQVERVNDYLFRHGYFPNAELAQAFPEWVPAVAEGPAAANVFDERTEEAVTIFQVKHGLASTGVVDATTFELM